VGAVGVGGFWVGFEWGCRGGCGGAVEWVGWGVFLGPGEGLDGWRGGGEAGWGWGGSEEYGQRE